jgi:hypothetical protein
MNIFGDPKSVSDKIEPIPTAVSVNNGNNHNYNSAETLVAKNVDSVWRYPMEGDFLPRPMNILALGGSNTLGVMLKSQYDAYPYLIGSPFLDHVHNVAMVEMGATYASMCLQSILSKSKSYNYDIILLDYIQTEGFPTLLQRLRTRYPDAILIYLHIWPLKPLLQEKVTAQSQEWEWISPSSSSSPTDTEVGDPQSASAYATFHPKMNSNVKRLVKNEGGYVYHLPLPSSPKVAMPWFTKDWWHLSEEGHKVVANDLLRVLWHLRDDIFNKPKRIVDWLGMGDHCMTWFLDGGSASSSLQKSQTNIKRIPWRIIKNGYESNDSSNSNISFDVFVLEIEQTNGGMIKFDNKFSHPISVVLAYLINIDDDDAHAPYSAVEVSIDDQDAVRIDPNYFYTPPYSSKVKYARIGIANPGQTSSMIFQTIYQRDLPFYAIGLFLTEGLDEISDEAFQRRNVIMNDSGYHAIFCYIQPYHQKANYAVVQELMDATRNELEPTSWNVHVITSDDTSLQTFSNRHNLHVVDYRNAPSSDRVKNLKKYYIHQSLNHMEFEYYCILRWIIISDYLNYLHSRGIPVRLILTLETDVLFLEDPLLIDTTVDWKHIESYRLISGVALLWSLEGSNNFANFILESYSSREKAMELVRKYAKVEETCIEDRSLLIPCFHPESTDATHNHKVPQMHMYHISDMYWYLAWVDQNPSIRIANRPNNDDHCAIVHPAPNKKILLVRDDKNAIVEKRVDGSDTSSTVCVIYFGRQKELILPFLQFFRGSSTEYLLSPMAQTHSLRI